LNIGRTRQRMAALLQREIPTLNGAPIIWTAENVRPAQGWYRTDPRADCYRWSAIAHGAESNLVLSVDSWHTMTEILKAGSLELVNREIYPKPKM
jgi:hypothetical protein